MNKKTILIMILSICGTQLNGFAAPNNNSIKNPPSTSSDTDDNGLSQNTEIAILGTTFGLGTAGAVALLSRDGKKASVTPKQSSQPSSAPITVRDDTSNQMIPEVSPHNQMLPEVSPQVLGETEGEDQPTSNEVVQITSGEEVKGDSTLVNNNDRPLQAEINKRMKKEMDASFALIAHQKDIDGLLKDNILSSDRPELLLLKREIDKEHVIIKNKISDMTRLNTIIKETPVDQHEALNKQIAATLGSLKPHNKELHERASKVIAAARENRVPVKE